MIIISSIFTLVLSGIASLICDAKGSSFKIKSYRASLITIDVYGMTRRHLSVEDLLPCRASCAPLAFCLQSSGETRNSFPYDFYDFCFTAASICVFRKVYTIRSHISNRSPASYKRYYQAAWWSNWQIQFSCCFLLQGRSCKDCCWRFFGEFSF